MTGQQVQALHIVDEVARRRAGSRLIGEQAPQRPWALHRDRYHQFLRGSPSCFTSTPDRVHPSLPFSDVARMVIETSKGKS